MVRSLKLTAFVLATSFAGLLQAGEHRYDAHRAARTSSYDSQGTQTVGLFDLVGGYGISARYGSANTARYRTNNGYGNSGYRFGQSRGVATGYGGYRAPQNRYHSTGYAPAYGRGYTGAGYGSGHSTGYGNGYGQGYGSGCSTSGYGRSHGYYGR